MPDCGRAARAKGLCVGHHRQQLRGKPLTPLRPGPGRPQGENTVALSTRISPETWARLSAWAQTANYGSAYRIARDVIATTLEHWGTPELQEKLATLAQPVSAGRRVVVVRRGRARRDNGGGGNVR